MDYSILSEPDRKFKTVISSVDPGLTTLSNGNYSTTANSSSGSSSSSSSAIYYYAKAIVDNSEGILRIGMTTQNTIHLESVKDAVIVPSMAIKKENGKHVVYVLKSDKSVQRREVQIGLVDSLRTQIKSGVEEGEDVVTSKSTAAELSDMVSAPIYRM